VEAMQLVVYATPITLAFNSLAKLRIPGKVIHPFREERHPS
jgi:hypothetical protein